MRQKNQNNSLVFILATATTTTTTSSSFKAREPKRTNSSIPGSNLTELLSSWWFFINNILWYKRNRTHREDPLRYFTRSHHWLFLYNGTPCSDWFHTQEDLQWSGYTIETSSWGQIWTHDYTLRRLPLFSLHLSRVGSVSRILKWHNFL